MNDSKMKLMKLMAKKPKISDKEKDAKMSVLDELQSTAKQALSSKIPGMKKITVASDSEMGLKKGLEKAEDIIEGKAREGLDSSEFEAESDEDAEMDQEEKGTMMEMSEDEIDAKIKDLMKMKQTYKGKKSLPDME